MNFIKTHLLLAENEEIKNSKNQSLNGFWDGVNLMSILNTVGGTWSQIEKARNGQPVYVKGENGESKNIAPILLSKLEQQAKTQQTSVDNLVKMMQLQMMQQNNKPKEKKDNTLIYVAIMATSVVLFGGIYLISKK